MNSLKNVPYLARYHDILFTFHTNYSLIILIVLEYLLDKICILNLLNTFNTYK